MAHIDNPREEFSRSTGIGIPLLIAFLYFAANIAMVVFAVLAFFSFRTDYENQQKLLLASLRNESSPIAEAIEQNENGYVVNYEKLTKEYQKYFDNEKLSDVKTDKSQTKQEFVAQLIESKAYSPLSNKTVVFALISVGLLLWLVLRSVRQIVALF